MRKEQLNLFNKANENLNASKVLFKEGLYSISVSRSYYAMFYLAQIYLLEDDLSFSKHSAVIAEFGYKFARTAKIPSEFHRNLINAQGKRNIADYDSELIIDKEEAENQMRKAEDFLIFTENYFKELETKDD